MNRSRRVLVVGVIGLTVGGLGVGAALAVSGGSSRPGSETATTNTSSHSYYLSMMGRFNGNSMMGGGSYGWMMGSTGYRWMMGGTSAPGWMHGAALPGFMMGTGTDPGKVMGDLFANAPGPRVSPAEATRLGNEVPSDATVDTAHHRISFSTSTVHLVVLANPSRGPHETFRIAGMVNPTIGVHAGARVSIEVVNADLDTAHGFVVTAARSTPSSMPMMTTHPAFSGSALWFLGNPTSAGMHAGTLTFTAATPGTFDYLCAVPDHAKKGMLGKFVVAA
jgi:rusticyanin